MLILASLSGIQDFLFDIRESGGGQARSLRNRSFRIQLVAECISLRLLEAARLPREHLVFSSAAKVCIHVEGLSADGVDAVRKAAADIERRLLSETHGRLRLSVVLEEMPGSFAEQFERAGRALVAKKMCSYATSARGAETWPDGMLVVRERWDADAEADRDAKVGRDLVNARWLTIRRADGAAGTDELDTLGFRIGLEAGEPTHPDGLVSCSNLADPEAAPRSVDHRFFHPRRLARHVPRDDRGNAIEFVDLAARARGAPMLGVLKADADSLGAAVSATLRESGGDGPAAMRGLSQSLDRFFVEMLEAEQARRDSRWSSIYTVFSGGDDLLAVGPWDVTLDFAAHARQAFDERFGSLAAERASPVPLTISAGVAIIKPKYPIHLAAQRADDLLDLAKGELAPGARTPKDQCAALGQVWKWQGHVAVVAAGRQLAEWVDTGVVQRGWLHTLLQLALLRRGQAGTEYAGVPPAVATSRLAYHADRNWPRARRRDDPTPPARAWIDDIVARFDDDASAAPVAVKYLPAIVRYALLATRAASEEDNR